MILVFFFWTLAVVFGVAAIECAGGTVRATVSRDATGTTTVA